MLMQELHRRCSSERPEVDDLLRMIRISGVAIHDGDDEADP